MAGWVRPILAAWQKKKLGPVDLLLLPCSFATGQEERVAFSLGVDRVYRPSDYLKLLWRDGRDYKDGTLLHLGGDLMYSAFLSWRWGMSTWSYLWARPWWNSAFQGFFTKDDWGVNWLRKRKVETAKIHLIGDLVLDAVRQNVPHPQQERQAQISYLPGSRSEELAVLTPFYLEVHRNLTRVYPGIKGVLHLSPYLPTDQVTRLMERGPDPAVGGIAGRVEGNKILADGCELELARADGYERLSESRLALSIPGTKTAEAGYLRTPTVTIVPLNKPEHLPSIGLVGLLDFLPGGRYLKGRLMLRLKDKIGLVAHPNILAGKALLPEYIERIQVATMSERLIEILKNEERLREVRETLQSLYSWESEPAQSLVEKLSSYSPLNPE